MTAPVTLHNLYYLIDTTAWLDQRTGTPPSEHSAQLQAFVRCDAFDQYRPSMDIAAPMRLWCAARGYAVGDDTVIQHDDECLTTPVTIMLAAATGMARQALALVSIDGGSPEVFADITTDVGYWFNPTTIQISRPGGHTWRWDGGRNLHAADGAAAHESELFGRNASVISRCRDCAAFHAGATEQKCLCSGFAIYCPTCGARCQVALPEIPVFEEPS
jgi:hypothetical protein